MTGDAFVKLGGMELTARQDWKLNAMMALIMMEVRSGNINILHQQSNLSVIVFYTERFINH